MKPLRRLSRRVLGKIYVRDLVARSLHRSLKEVSWQDLLDNTRLPRTHTLRELCSRYALQHFTRAISDGNLKEKCRTPEPRRTLCASLRNQNACQHCRRATLHRNLQVKCRRPERAQNADTHTHLVRACMHVNTYRNSRVKCLRPEEAQNADTHFVRACAFEMHVNIAEEPLHTEIYR